MLYYLEINILDIQKFISDLGFPIFCAVLLLLQYVAFTRFFFANLISHFREISNDNKEAIHHLADSFEKVSGSLDRIVKNCPVSASQIKEAIRDELMKRSIKHEPRLYTKDIGNMEGN